MRFINGQLYLDFADAIAAGISESYLCKVKSTGAKPWQFVKDEHDRRRVLIHYESIPDAYKQLILAKLGNPYEHHSRHQMASLLIRDADALKFYTHYRLPDGSALPNQAIISYTNAAELLNMLITIDKDKCGFIKKYGMSLSQLYESVTQYISNEKIDLPANYSNLRRKLKAYRNQGYGVLVSKKYGNDNSEKLSDAAKDFLIAHYSSPLKPNVTKVWTLYINECIERRWKPVSEAAVYRFLMLPDVKPLWFIGRHGGAHYKNKFEHHLKLKTPSHRDALWEGDGTKLNFFTHKAMRAELNAYLVIDSYSEMILGYHFSTEHENFKVQHKALRMAVRNSGTKPLQFLYDNQGGHKKEEQQQFFAAISKWHFPAQAYNPQAKNVERIIGRWQQQVLSRHWFFTGQNVQSKKLDSKPNIEFFKEHKDKLPSIEQLIGVAEQSIVEWNNAIHSRYGKSRVEVYNESVNPHTQALDYFDLVNMFWYSSRTEVKYLRGGITLQIGKDKYVYEVLDAKTGLPDLSLIEDSFILKYDPDDLNEICLYKKQGDDLRFIAIAAIKQEVPRALVDYQEHDRAAINKLLKHRKEGRYKHKEQLDEIRKRASFSADDILKAEMYMPKELVQTAKAEIYFDATDFNEGKILDI